MKKYFDIVETVKYSHRVVIEINDSQDSEFESFAQNTATEMEEGAYDCTEDIVSKFTNKYGDKSIEFIEDGSPSSEYEAY